MKSHRTVFVILLLIAGVVGWSQQQSVYYLTGNLKETAGTIITDKGEQRATFLGMVGFKLVPAAQGFDLTLFELNLISKGVPTAQGHSGVLGLNLIDDEPTWLDPKTARAALSPTLVLHYPLIDQVKGFRQVRGQAEGDVFVPFTETMRGKISVRFPESVKVAETGSTYVDLDMTLELSSSVLGSIRRITLVSQVVVDWSRLTTPALYLRIQPVFIGTGPTDSTATGKNFPELMKRATELWNRCGSVRCIKFAVNDPIYLNKPAYKVLDTSAEITSLRAEIDVVDAVEVFVVERLAACDLIGGGGACYSTGAAAKIVTTDEQLAVPCPCPPACRTFCPCGGCGTSSATCGAVNYYHLAHELGHALYLDHPGQPYGLAEVTAGSVMEPSGFCCDNPNVQSAKNCRNATNPLLYWGRALCVGRPDIAD